MDKPTEALQQDGATLAVPAPPLSLIELGVVLVKHYDLHEGVYDVSVEFQIAVGGFGPDAKTVYPSAIIGVSKLGLRTTSKEKAGPNTVDAAEVNPAPSTAKRARSDRKPKAE